MLTLLMDVWAKALKSEYQAECCKYSVEHDWVTCLNEEVAHKVWNKWAALKFLVPQCPCGSSSVGQGASPNAFVHEHLCEASECPWYMLKPYPECIILCWWAVLNKSKVVIMTTWQRHFYLPVMIARGYGLSYSTGKHYVELLAFWRLICGLAHQGSASGVRHTNFKGYKLAMDTSGPLMCAKISSTQACFLPEWEQYYNGNNL